MEEISCFGHGLYSYLFSVQVGTYRTTGQIVPVFLPVMIYFEIFPNLLELSNTIANSNISLCEHGLWLHPNKTLEAIQE
jgi:hypothetical protein